MPKWKQLARRSRPAFLLAGKAAAEIWARTLLLARLQLQVRLLQHRLKTLQGRHPKLSHRGTCASSGRHTALVRWGSRRIASWVCCSVPVA